MGPRRTKSSSGISDECLATDHEVENLRKMTRARSIQLYAFPGDGTMKAKLKYETLMSHISACSLRLLIMRIIEKW